MSDEIVKILDDLGQRFGVVIDWSSENVMPYLQDLMGRYINYEIITSIVWLIALTICCIGMGVAIPNLIKYEKKYNESCSLCNEIVWPSVVSIVFAGLIVFCVIMIGFEIDDIIMCKTIPEKIIINYINTLI